jgi:hypothetical protein
MFKRPDERNRECCHADHLEQSRRALSRSAVEPELEFTPGSACFGFAEPLPASGFAIGVRSSEPE